MKYLILIMAIFACEGPEGPMGPVGETDTLVVFINPDRETVWLYPEDVIMQYPGADTFGRFETRYTTDTIVFDIDYGEYTSRRGQDFWYLMQYELYEGEVYLVWSRARWIRSDPNGKIKVSGFPYYINGETWEHAYFEWDAWHLATGSEP